MVESNGYPAQMRGPDDPFLYPEEQVYIKVNSTSLQDLK
jgi:hypothetical protein